MSDLLDRVVEKIEIGDDCWEWTAGHNSKGYGTFANNDDRERSILAHRLLYELVVGPVPDGLELDHLCRNRGCVNPDHLEPVTHAENMRRGKAGEFHSAKTHCPQGHEYNDENTYWRPDRKSRNCRVCVRDAMRRYRERNQ